MTQSTDPPPEWRIRDIAREAAELAAKQAVETFCLRIGIDDLQRTRRNLDFLASQAEAATGRRNEGRKTVFAVIGGITMMVVGYLAAAIGFKGHLP